MTKVIYKLQSDKRGFTLTELIVTVTIMAIATLLLTNLMRTIIQNYRLVEYRWMVQTFVKQVAESFQSNADREALATADEAYMYYNDMGDPPSGGATTTSFTLSSCPELGQITYNNQDFTISFTPANTDENLELLKKCYIYFITFDKHFFVIDYTDYLNIETTTDSEGKTDLVYSVKPGPIVLSAKNGEMMFGEMADTDYQLDISFTYSISTMSPEKEKGNVPEDATDLADRRFLQNAVTAEVKGVIRNTVLDYLKANETYVSSFDLLNLVSNKGINYAPTNTTLSTYAAGWNDRGLTKNSTETDEEYTARLVARNSAFPNYAPDGLSNPTAKANVLKYHSVNTESILKDAIGETSVPSVALSMPICLFTSLTIGSDRQTQILEPIRDFRDNVLRGNAVGEWVIDKYYDWSPTVIGWTEKSPALKGALQLVTKGVAAAATIAVE